MDPEIALVTAGVETDVLGVGRSELDGHDIAEVVAVHPRPDFKRRMLAAFADGFRHRPDSTFGTMNADVLRARESVVPAHRFRRGDHEQRLVGVTPLF